jgi:hypothetical protein
VDATNRGIKFFSHIAISLLTVLVIGAGCSGSERELHIEISNGTAEEVTEALVHFGKSRCSAGVLSSGSAKTHLFYEAPITAQASVKWTDVNGLKIEKGADVAGVYDRKGSGTLRFQIVTNDVLVTFTPRTHKPSK